MKDKLYIDKLVKARKDKFSIFVKTMISNKMMKSCN